MYRLERRKLTVNVETMIIFLLHVQAHEQPFLQRFKPGNASKTTHEQSQV